MRMWLASTVFAIFNLFITAGAFAQSAVVTSQSGDCRISDLQLTAIRSCSWLKVNGYAICGTYIALLGKVSSGQTSDVGVSNKYWWSTSDFALIDSAYRDGSYVNIDGTVIAPVSRNLEELRDHGMVEVGFSCKVTQSSGPQRSIGSVIVRVSTPTGSDSARLDQMTIELVSQLHQEALAVRRANEEAAHRAAAMRAASELYAARAQEEKRLLDLAASQRQETSPRPPPSSHPSGCCRAIK